MDTQSYVCPIDYIHFYPLSNNKKIYKKLSRLLNWVFLTLNSEFYRSLTIKRAPSIDVSGKKCSTVTHWNNTEITDTILGWSGVLQGGKGGRKSGLFSPTTASLPVFGSFPPNMEDKDLTLRPSATLGADSTLTPDSSSGTAQPLHSALPATAIR